VEDSGSGAAPAAVSGPLLVARVRQRRRRRPGYCSCLGWGAPLAGLTVPGSRRRTPWLVPGGRGHRAGSRRRDSIPHLEPAAAPGAPAALGAYCLPARWPATRSDSRAFATARVRRLTGARPATTAIERSISHVLRILRWVA